MIKISHIKKIFDPKRIAGLHGVNLNIEPGQIHALLGPSGCGKSTLVKIIEKTLSPDSGEVLIQGSLSCVSEDNEKLFRQDESLLENLVRLHPQKGESELSEIRYFLDFFELSNERHQPWNTLSEGQKQRALLVQALCPVPENLLLDEPFSKIDYYLRFDLLQKIRAKLKEQKVATFWITHEVRDALCFADTISVMNYGKIEQTDTAQNIFFRPASLFVAKFTGFCNARTLQESADQFITEIKRPHLSEEQVSDSDFFFGDFSYCRRDGIWQKKSSSSS